MRLAVVGDTAARGLLGTFPLDFALVVLSMGLLGAFLPYGTFQTAMRRENPFAPLLTAFAAVPLYVNPTEAIRVIGTTIRDGFSVGAAFSFLVLGAGTILATMNGMRRESGWRKALLFAVVLLVSTLALAHAADLFPPRSPSAPQSHTHAFDGFTRLSSVDRERASLSAAIKMVLGRLHPNESVGLIVVAGLLVAGAVLTLIGPRADTRRLMRNETDDLDVPVGTSWNRR